MAVRHYSPRIAAVTLTALALCFPGCASLSGGQTPGAGQADLMESLFPGQVVPSRFRAMTGSGDWSGAAAYYARHPEVLDAEAPDEVGQLAGVINADWQPRLDAALSGLRQASDGKQFAPAPLADAYHRAEALLQQYRTPRLLAGPRYQLAVAGALQTELDRLPVALVERLGGVFPTYDHAGKPVLFADLPFSPDPAALRALVLKKPGVIARAIEKAPLDKARQLLAVYGDVLSAEDKVPLHRAYYAAYVRQRFGDARRLSFAQLADVSAAMEVVGAPPTLRTLTLTDGVGEGSLSLTGAGAPGRATVGELGNEIRAAGKTGQQYLLILDGPRQAGFVELTEPGLLAERQVVGQETLPNPDYDRVQQELRAAEDDYRQQTIDNQNLQMQARQLAQQSQGSGFGALAAVFGSSTGTYLVESSRQKVEELRAEARKTPASIRRPVYGEVKVPVAARQLETLTEFVAYLVDLKTMNVRSVRQQSSQKRKEMVKGTGIDTALPAAETPTISVDPKTLDGLLAAARSIAVKDIAASIDKDRKQFVAQAMVRQRQAEQGSEKTRLKLAQLTVPKGAAPGGAEGAARPPTRGQCNTTLAYLDNQLPRFRAAILQEARRGVLRQSVTDAIRNAKAQGLSASDAIDAAQQQAAAYDDNLRESSACAADVSAMGHSAEQILQSVKSGGAAGVSTCDGIHNACLCNAFNVAMGARAMRAIAVDMQCFADAGRF